MNSIKKVILPFAALSPFFLSSCASTQNYGVADFNRDGVISNAEYLQYQKQKDIEDRNVYSESVKRRNATNTVRDARDAVGGVRDLRNIIRNF